MARKRYKVDVLSLHSIRQLKKDLDTYKNDLHYKCQLIAQELARLGCDIAKVHITTLNAIFTGELISSITSSGIITRNKATFFIVADSEHAAFVEFGTGYEGKFSPYPYPLPNSVSWQYLVGDQLIANAQNGLYGWFYKGDDGNIYFTEGMAARPFMYDTARELEGKVIKVVKEVFRRK